MLGEVEGSLRQSTGQGEVPRGKAQGKVEGFHWRWECLRHARPDAARGCCSGRQ